MSSINGIGTTYIGCSDVARDGSYITTKWVKFILPIVPVGSYRVWPGSHINLGFYTSSKFQEQPVPLYWSHVIWIYATYLAVAIFLVGVDRLTGPNSSQHVSSPFLSSVIAFVLSILAFRISRFIREPSVFANLIVFAVIITFSFLAATNMSPQPEKSAQYMYYLWAAYVIFFVIRFFTKNDSENEKAKVRR